jgi:hypothetical protein
VRTRAGELRAHDNLCRHRGSQVVPQAPAPQGTEPPAARKAGSLRCPTTPGPTRWTAACCTRPGPRGGRLRPGRVRPAPGRGGDLGRVRVPAPDARRGGPPGRPARPRAGAAAPGWTERGIPHREGAWTFTASGTSARAPFPGLDEDERTRHKGELVYPNLMLSLSADHVAAFTLWPHGPNATTVVCADRSPATTACWSASAPPTASSSPAARPPAGRPRGARRHRGGPGPVRPRPGRPHRPDDRAQLPGLSRRDAPPDCLH